MGYLGGMSELTKLHSRIDPRLKELLVAYTERSGRSIQYVINHALASWLEDAEDLDAIEERRNEPTISHEELKKALEL